MLVLVCLFTGAALGIYMWGFGSLAWHHGAMIVLMATCAIWSVRFFARLYMLHLHLAEDASLRETMVSCYYALLAHTEIKLSDQDRSLVLQALFRPAAELRSDDGMPPGLYDALSRLSTK